MRSIFNNVPFFNRLKRSRSSIHRKLFFSASVLVIQFRTKHVSLRYYFHNESYIASGSRLKKKFKLIEDNNLSE